MKIGRTFCTRIRPSERCYGFTLIELLVVIAIIAILATRAVVRAEAWEPLPVFRAIRDRGGVDRDECYRVMNMGMGMVLVAAPGDVEPLLASLAEAGERGARVIGALEAGPRPCAVRFGP